MTVTVNENVPVVVGVPEIVPSVARDRPVGSDEPSAIAQVGVEPVALRVMGVSSFPVMKRPRFASVVIDGEVAATFSESS